METMLWAARFQRNLEEQAALLAPLPPERSARLARSRVPSRRREALAAYTLLRLALREALGWQDLPEIAPGRYGKPCFPAFPGVCFNLSHTDGAALAGLSEQPIGVDIEKIRPVSARLTRRIGGAADAEVTPEAFFRRWVLAEAAAKRDGRGIGAILKSGNLPEAIDRETRLLPELFPGYLAAAAVSPGCAAPRVIVYHGWE